MKNDKVSVIVPIYNRERFIAKCISSIINQTYKNLEIILINDGSTDKSLEICKKFAKKDSRIIIIDSKNEGVSSARNKGITRATGLYLMFVDSDDYIEYDMIDSMVNKQKETNTELVICDLYFEDLDKNIVEKKQLQNMDNINRDTTITNILSIKKTFYGFLCNKLFLTDIIKENKIRLDNEIRYREDLLFCTSYCLYIKSASYNKKRLYHYVIHKNSATNGNYDEYKKINDRLNSIEANYKIYKETQNYNNCRLRCLARNLFYINVGELLSKENIHLEIIGMLRDRYDFNYYDFFKSIFEKEIPIYLKLIAIKGLIKSLCKRKK